MRFFRVTGLLACFFAAAVGGIALASDTVELAFAKVGGGTYQLVQTKELKATILIFFGHDCPMSNGYVPEIQRLHDEYKSKGIDFCIVYADSDLAETDARKHVKEYKIEVPAILDPEQKLARLFEATTKPEVALLSPDRNLLYRGRIDNRYADFGKRRTQITSQELRDAIESILNNQPIAVPRTKALGCDIYFPPVKK